MAAPPNPASTEYHAFPDDPNATRLTNPSPPPYSHAGNGAGGGGAVEVQVESSTDGGRGTNTQVSCISYVRRAD